MKKIKNQYCGKIAIIGNQNSGKSSLMNKLIGKKISITSRKKNTTQRNILGIKTIKNYQFIYIDTPGFKKQKNLNFTKDLKLNHYSLKNLKLIILVIDTIIWNKNYNILLNLINKKNIPNLIVINKIDKIKKKNKILPFIEYIHKKFSQTKIIPVSSKTGDNIKILEKIIKKKIPIQKHLFHKNINNNYSLKFQIYEIIRETIMRYFGDELPYSSKIKIKSIQKNIRKEMIINSEIFVLNVRQKKIFIGKNGTKIKLFSMISKVKLEKILNTKIHLFIWIKILKNN
ncbi:GTPase Era [Buchnera aphidicola]|uniref:GTPase Era n=1 Tax=Buchnera aphidicola TaxID=9 RepID=UPI0022382622|nr:GTPase Era [Buchnera aphidicola]MCW5197673.1 GTPase Era [Buchnera aphidicola (Chaitophorus viminalis)]